MPALGCQASGSVSHEDGGRGNWPTDIAVINRFASGLQAAAEEGIRRAADAESGRFRRRDDVCAIGAVDSQGLFAIDVFASLNNLARDSGMRRRDGQIDDDVNVVARQQIVHAVCDQTIFSGECPGAVDQDIGASGYLDDVKRRAATDIRRRNVAGADDAKFQRSQNPSSFKWCIHPYVLSQVRELLRKLKFCAVSPRSNALGREEGVG